MVTKRLLIVPGFGCDEMLEDQTQLATLADARAVVVKHLTKRVDDAALTQVLKLLLIAALSETLSDRKAATDQLEMVLKSQVLH